MAFNGTCASASRAICVVLLAQVVLQCIHALAVRTDIGIGGGDNPADFSGDSAIHIRELCTNGLDVWMTATEPCQQRLQFC